jgi:hypothetical protein
VIASQRLTGQVKLTDACCCGRAVTGEEDATSQQSNLSLVLFACMYFVQWTQHGMAQHRLG